jgi:Domain of unknown function (DUF932)
MTSTVQEEQKSSPKTQKTVLKKVLKSGQHDIREVGVYADYTQADNVWKQKFGIVGVPVMATDSVGNVVGNSGMKIEVQESADPKVESYIKVALPDSLTFVPHEAIDELTADNGKLLEKKLLDFNPELKKNGFKIEYAKKKESHKGLTAHWIVQTNLDAKINNSWQKNDMMKFGFCIRNGYNTATSLGIDIFTMRLICENGAFHRSKSLQKMSFKHVGKDPKKLFATFETAIMKAIEDWAEVLQEYELMAKTKLNQKMTEYIYERNNNLPDRFFPDYYNVVDEKQRKKDQPLVVLAPNVQKNGTVTLWQNFNDMTKPLWRSDQPETYTKKNGKEGTHKGTSFSELAWRERRLQDSMSYILANPKEFA